MPTDENADKMASLEEREKRLKERLEKDKLEIKPIGMRLDILMDIAEELNNNDELKKIFGEPVVNKLAIISDNYDLKICDAKVARLTSEQEKRFMEILKDILTRKMEEISKKK